MPAVFASGKDLLEVFASYAVNPLLWVYVRE